MTEGNLLKASLVAALALCATASGASATPCAKGNIVLAADASQTAGAKTDETDSAKMGKEEGTHTGANQGAKTESDTDKVDQPERRNPTTGN